MSSVGSLVIGLLAILGALFLVHWAYNRYQASQAAAVPVVRAAQVMPAQPATTMPPPPPPCVAPPLNAVAPASMSACGCGNAPPTAAAAAPSRNDLFPNSYVAFGFAQNGNCAPGDARRKC